MRPYFSNWRVYIDGDCTARYGHVWMDDRAGGQVSGCGGLGREIKRDFGSGGITYGMKENTPVSGPNFPFFPIRQPGFTKMQPYFSNQEVCTDGDCTARYGHVWRGDRVPIRAAGCRSDPTPCFPEDPETKVRSSSYPAEPVYNLCNHNLEILSGTLDGDIGIRLV